MKEWMTEWRIVNDFFLQVGGQVARKFMIRLCEYSICQILRTRSTPTHMNCHVLCECYSVFCLYSGDIWCNAPINGLPQDGKVGGNPREIWHFQFSKVNFPTPGSPFWVKFPSLGRMIGTHNSLYCSTERLQRKIKNGDKIMEPTNFVYFPKCIRHILAGYLVWLAI